MPGGHGPGGNMTQVSGLVIRAGDRRLAWQRDPVEIEALHVEVPEDARALEIDFEHLSPVGSARGRHAMSRDLVNLDWTTLLLYPAGHWLSAIRVKPTVTLPVGFEAAT